MRKRLCGSRPSNGEALPINKDSPRSRTAIQSKQVLLAIEKLEVEHATEE